LSDLYAAYLTMTAHERIAFYQSMHSRNHEEQRLFYRASAERTARRVYPDQPDQVAAVMRKFDADWEHDVAPYQSSPPGQNHTDLSASSGSQRR
jgi:hypothetical protein